MADLSTSLRLEGRTRSRRIVSRHSGGEIVQDRRSDNWRLGAYDYASRPEHDAGGLSLAC